MDKKFDCYKCKHRGTVPGDCHSCCKHPSVGDTSPIGAIMGILASVGRVSPVKKENSLNIKGVAHGINNGWFNWPYNFDPTWLENCDGFESEEIKKEEV